MARNEQHDREGLIDLGAIEVETKGTGDVPSDSQGGLRQNIGLSDED